jgi:DNA sulfur modification protein DndD
VFRDGKPLPIADVQTGDAEVGNEYDTLLRVLIPAHFAQFYFFDAEKMRGIFNRPKPEDVAQAVRDLLGLSIYERLSADMRDYRKSKLPALYGKHAQKQAELKARQADQAKIQAEIGQIEEEISDGEEELGHINRQLESREAEFKRLGGAHKEEIEKLRGELANCEAEYETLTKQLKEAMTGRIASCFLLPLKAPIEQRLRAEREWRLHDMKRNSVEPHIETLQEKIFGEAAPAPEPPLSGHQTEFFKERLEQEIKSLFIPPPPGYEQGRWFDLREQDEVEIVGSLDEAARFSSGALRDIIETKNRISGQRDRIKEKLANIGDTPLTQEIAAEIKRLVEERGKLTERLSQARERLTATQAGLSELAGQITDLEKQCGKSARGKEREDLSKKVEAVIEEYLHLAATEKADDIERHLNKLFLRMANCRDEIRQVHLDRQSYALTILGKDGRERPLDTGLSEGQAQVLALAFVGALAKASGRILPRIIDTPLGRLDVNHRRDVTQHFFIGDSPQTILLSTPTEINNCIYDGVPLKLLDDLRPHVAHAYTLERAGDGLARVAEGYFGNRF